VDPATFLHGLWGTGLPERARIQTWRLADKRATLLRSHTGAAGLAGTPDVYTGVALTHADAPSGARRPSARDARGLAGFWLDIDIKPGGAPDLDAALALATSILQPTVVIHTGGGIHAWHLFTDGPWIFTSVDGERAARAAAGWQNLHRKRAQADGWGIDSTADLARLMRLPGTINAKTTPPRPVDVHSTGGRHNGAQLVDLALAAAPAVLPNTTAGRGAVDLTGTADLGDRLQILLDDDEDFAATFHHARRMPHAQGAGLSEYDLSLATQLVAAGGWTNDDIAAVIAAHRKHHGDTTGKAQRVSYLRLTIGRARSNAERQAAHDTAALLALTPPARRAA
jgi:hypothetical protein